MVWPDDYHRARAHPNSPSVAFMSNCAPAREIYADLFGELGNSLSAEDWIARANISLPPNLSALKARFVTGSRTEQALQISYEPGPESFSFFALSGGCTAEMLDQAATHCATLVTGYGCPTLTMTTNYFHRGTGSTFVANARILSMTSVSALIVAELIDQRGRRIAAASVAVQFVKEIARYR
jgi:acyl-coenzyme A thioesterase PaaI-like protein